MAYAEGTTVAFDTSIGEIIALLRKAGAREIGQFDDDLTYAIQFALAGRVMRFRLSLPSIEDMPARDGRERLLSREQRTTRLAQSRRQRGRALLLVIKAKLESVESNIETIEQAFLAHIVLPGDRLTVYERVAAPLALEYQTGTPDAVAGLLALPKGQ